MSLPSAGQHYRNSLLASLPELENRQFAPHLTQVALDRGQVLHEPGETLESVYFLEQGICTLVSAMQDGSTVEVGMIGRESVVGMPALLGAGSSLSHCVMQLSGWGYRVKARTAEREFLAVPGELRKRLLLAIHGLLVQTAQTAACNRIHQIEERLARWLLMCHDRMQTDHMSITHEFLAVMLGTRRSTVTVAAGILQRAGFIEYSHGNVSVVDRPGLESAACECYLVVHEEYVRLGLF